ncbi:hypothetical protein BDZ45DRAFT_670507 [Acephala macrosclerotiorum]|nr:hypothetical protein BDZ45DRAFT_670507 [Acephala macrosclerotiorum]
MSKRSVFTTLTPLPAGISRETVMETLRSHTEMIDLNPLVEERHPIKPPPNATAEEYHCVWYSLTDKVQYLPGGLASGKVSYTCCFHDLENGLQTHCYAPMGLNIKGKWTLGGSLPGEPLAPVELGVGAPLSGLWLREDVDMKCNFMMTSFVKKTLQKAHSKLVDRLLVKAQIVDASMKNQEIFAGSQASPYPPSISEQSTSDDGNQSPFSSNPHLSLSPATDNSSVSSFRPLELSHFGEKNSGLGLYNSALSPQNNRVSMISNRSSYQPPQETPHNVRDPYNQRVSWQNLNQNPNPMRSPSMHNVDPAYGQANPYRASYQPPLQPQQEETLLPMTYAAELHSEEKVDAWRSSQRSLAPPPPRKTPQILEPGRPTPAHKGFPVELE